MFALQGGFPRVEAVGNSYEWRRIAEGSHRIVTRRVRVPASSNCWGMALFRRIRPGKWPPATAAPETLGFRNPRLCLCRKGPPP
ncbi:MAG: hypothetical protein Kow001_07280 [Acidobacteriota bacterium]